MVPDSTPAVRLGYASIRWLFRISLLLLIIDVGTTIVAYPVIVTTAPTQALIYLGLFLLAILIYGGVTFTHMHAATQANRVAVQQGAIWGLLCGGAWSAELLVANLLGLEPGRLDLLLYFGSAAIAYVAPALAGLCAAWRTGQRRAGIAAGLLCGMGGGLAIFLSYIAFSALLLGAAQTDPQTLHEFERSGLPDLKTYLVGDYLAGMIAHLWIGLISGLSFGTAGGILGRAMSRPPLQSSRDHTTPIE